MLNVGVQQILENLYKQENSLNIFLKKWFLYLTRQFLLKSLFYAEFSIFVQFDKENKINLCLAVALIP